jgi:clan AA aspartic protease (TIGR02281 family)
VIIPKTKIFHCSAVFFALLLYVCAVPASADTIYFKNGGSINGIVKAADKNSVEVEIGFGTITLGRGQIRDMEISTPDEHLDMRSAWDEKRSDLEKREDEFAAERKTRFAEYDKWIREEQEKKRREVKGVKEASFSRDEESRHILVNAILNDTVPVRLILDTGASLVVLSNKIARQLGIDLSDPKKDAVTLHLAGGQTIPAKMIVLKSVKVEGAEVRNVVSAVLTSEEPVAGFSDGLLGMTFLSKFNVRMDLNAMKISLEPINKQQ